MRKPMGLVRHMEATMAFESQTICYPPHASSSLEGLTLSAFTWSNLSRFLLQPTGKRGRQGNSQHVWSAYYVSGIFLCTFTCKLTIHPFDWPIE